MKVCLTLMILFKKQQNNVETIEINKDYKTEKDKSTDALIDELF